MCIQQVDTCQTCGREKSTDKICPPTARCPQAGNALRRVAVSSTCSRCIPYTQSGRGGAGTSKSPATRINTQIDSARLPSGNKQESVARSQASNTGPAQFSTKILSETSSARTIRADIQIPMSSRTAAPVRIDSSRPASGREMVPYSQKDTIRAPTRNDSARSSAAPVRIDSSRPVSGREVVPYSKKDSQSPASHMESSRYTGESSRYHSPRAGSSRYESSRDDSSRYESSRGESSFKNYEAPCPVHGCVSWECPGERVKDCLLWEDTSPSSSRELTTRPRDHGSLYPSPLGPRSSISRSSGAIQVNIAARGKRSGPIQINIY